MTRPQLPPAGHGYRARYGPTTPPPAPPSLEGLAQTLAALAPLITRIDVTQADLDTLHRRVERTREPISPFAGVPVTVDPDLPPRTMRATYSDGSTKVVTR